MNVWDVTILHCKSMTYQSMLTVPGAFFLALVGPVNQQGLARMLYQEIGAIMASTALGMGCNGA